MRVVTISISEQDLLGSFLENESLEKLRLKAEKATREYQKALNPVRLQQDGTL